VELPPDTIGLLEGLVTTRAIRRLRPDPVSDDDLAAVLFAATRAPSGSNRQPFRFLVLRDGPRAAEANSPKARMDSTMQRFVDNFEQVPVVVLACLQRYRPANPYEGNSVYPACQNLLLAARARGLGGVMTMWHAVVWGQPAPWAREPVGTRHTQAGPPLPR
jgi:nitroreductase